MALGAHMRHYSYIYCAPHRDGLRALRRVEIAANPLEAQALRRSSRIRVVPKRYGFLISKQNVVLLIEDNEPTTYEEYLNSLENDKWLIAMK